MWRQQKEVLSSSVMLRQAVLNIGLGYEGVSVKLIIKKSPSVISN